MTAHLNRVQPGVPTGGQFAPTTHDESDVVLTLVDEPAPRDAVEDFLTNPRPEWNSSATGMTTTWHDSTLGVAPVGSDPFGPHLWTQVGPGGFARGTENTRDEAMLAAETTARRTQPAPTEETDWRDDEDGGSLATFRDGRFMAIQETSGRDGSAAYHWSVGVDREWDSEDSGFCDDFDQARAEAEKVLAERFPPPPPPDPNSPWGAMPDLDPWNAA